ncbi:DUF1716 domain-containing protein [Aphelenchoides bicaudatus]|nr:DUF1716 domain-containing protein [Aphelenchoides bicaudatus]
MSNLWDGPSSSKRPRQDLSTANATSDEIIAALDQEDFQQQDVLDEAAVKKLVNQLEKKFSKNRELRIKYADEPQKFLDSEMELNNAIQDVHAIASQLELYQVFVQLGAVTLLLQLLAHENNDIVAVVSNLLQELTDLDTLYENEDSAKCLIDELMNQRIIETIVQQGLKRLNEADKDEEDAVHNLLSVVENLLEFRPETCKAAIEEGLFNWLLLRATRKGEFNANKNYASQHLAVILQTSPEARKALVEKIDGIDLLLRALAVYKKNDPSTRDEGEHMENLFDSLCTALLHTPNRTVFLDNEGLQLLNLMLREKKQSRSGALKVLSYATAIPDGGPNCDKFIDIYGLRTLFPMFMRTPDKNKKKDTMPDEHDEHVLSVIDALLFQCSDENKERVLQKFAEHEYEKVDRTVELFLKYKERVDKFTERFKRTAEEDLDPEDLYAEQLNNGLYTLQRVALILAEVTCKGPEGCDVRASKLLKMKLKSTLSEQITPILRALHSFFDEEAANQKTRVEKLILSLELKSTNSN